MKTILAATSLLLAFVAFSGAATAQGPGLQVCWKGHNASDCYGGHDICVSYSYQVPQCIDEPVLTCAQPFCDPTQIFPVSVCHDENRCYGGHDVCIGFSEEIPFCLDYVECACMPLY
jgi:hypothetical protein